MRTTDQRLGELKSFIRWTLMGILIIGILLISNVWFSCANQESAIRGQMKNSQIALTSVYSVFQTQGGIAEKDRKILQEALASNPGNALAIIQGSGAFSPDTQLMGNLQAALDQFSKEQVNLTRLGTAYQERLNRPIDGFIARIEGFPHDGLNNPAIIVDPTAEKVHETGHTDWSAFQ
jgi:hypothetical protein